MAIYASTKEAPKLKLTLADGTKIVFNNCSFDTDTLGRLSAAVEIELDNLIKEKSNVALLIRKIDRSAAEAIAREHMAKMRNQAVSGTFSSQSAAEAAKDHLKLRDAELANLEHADPKIAAAMSEQIRGTDLQLTVSAEGVQAPETNEGFTVTTPEPAEPAAVSTDATPETQQPAGEKQTFNALFPGKK